MLRKKPNCKREITKQTKNESEFLRIIVIINLIMKLFRLLDEIMERKTTIFWQVLNLMEAMAEESDTENQRFQDKMLKAKELSQDFDELISKTWPKLMHREVILHEQLEVIL